jgi:hypothetical protein
LALCFSQLADDLGSRALGALLLGNGMVSAGELGGGAIATRIHPVAFDLSTVTGVAGPLDRRRHCGEEEALEPATGLEGRFEGGR